MSRARDLGDVGSKANFLDNVSTDLGDYSGQSIPHIIPDVLYPAVEGKDLAGVAFSGSYVYGTEHTDGRKYYYTDIKGSKPIKDPRIGGHFGSQRHKFKSLQLLEQETATHGSSVYSVDGREWLRVFSLGESVSMQNDDAGHYLNWVNHFAVEIVGYFNQLNMICLPWTDNGSTHKTYLDGSLQSATWSTNVTAGSPLGGRYVDGGSLINISFDSAVSLGIHTIRIEPPNDSTKIGYTYGCELIAQDTSNRNNIQIPSQNVVSYGKKFTVSGTPHYDPFNGFTSGSSVSSYIDTATSLGVENWKHSSTYYRPYNGGRVVKWVDSNGVIKTSVTLMPPNAKSIADSSSLTNGTAKANASASNDTFYPTFEAHTTDVNEDNLHEVAKTFHWREFGNGSANGGTGATYADASMLSGTDDNAFVMDDGLTSLSAYGSERATISDASGGDVHRLGGYSNYCYLTFIGIGISFPETYAWNASEANDETTQFSKQFVQNLPYGTHIIQLQRESNGGNNDGVVKIDGVSVLTNVKNPLFSQISIHQPKRPPIPEDAVVLCDYMLLADFVPQTSAGVDKISKGVRSCSISRDVFFNTTKSGASFNFSQDVADYRGWKINQSTDADSNTDFTYRCPSFSKNWVVRAENVTQIGLYNGSSASAGDTGSGNSAGNYKHLTTSLDLGVYNSGWNALAFQNPVSNAIEFATPIHTSHHYQSFETPFLHELVGGDRNMEQTNLVVSPDGKTWDEVTRDKSYLASDIVLSATNNTPTTWSDWIILDEWRGQPLHTGSPREKECFNKESWAIAYDRLICLKDGTYEMFTVGAFDSHQDIYVNENSAQLSPNASHSGMKLIRHMKRGDYIRPRGDFGDNSNVRYSHFYIKKIS